jgi:transcription elongation factor GreA
LVFFVDRTPFGYCSRICDCQDVPGEIWLKREFDFGRERGVKGGDAISLPPSAPRFPVSRNVFRGVKEMSIERIPMSREGYEKLKADLDRMQNFEMIEVTERIATARAHGDLSENAEYHAAREDQGMLQARIEALKDKMSRGFIVDRNNHLNSETVAFGMRVVVKDLDLDEEETFVLVGPGDEDYNNNKILTSSPIGQGLMGKKRGEVVEIQVPMGKVRFEIQEISMP